MTKLLASISAAALVFALTSVPTLSYAEEGATEAAEEGTTEAGDAAMEDMDAESGASDSMADTEEDPVEEAEDGGDE